MDIPRKHDNKPVSASTKLSDIFDTAINQNFIPVIDDEKHFIGIITRKKIMNHLASKQ